MKQPQSVDRDFYVFLAIAVAGGMGFQLIYALFQKNAVWLVLAMWAPALAVSLVSQRRHIFSKLKIVQPKWIALGILLGATPYILEQLIYYVTCLGHWNSDRYVLVHTADAARLTVKKGNLVFGNGQQSVSFFTFNLTCSLLFAALMTALLGAVGEEIGWRGFLQPKLNRILGNKSGLLVLGLIWGYWHLPCNLAGANGAENIFLNSLLIFPLGVVFITFELGWLRDRSGALWPCALLHGANNAVQGNLPMVPNSELTGQLIELACYMPIGLVFIFLLSRRSRNSARG